MVQKKSIPVLWEEEFSDVWMVEVENEVFLNDALDTYQVVRNIVDSMVDIVDAHNVDWVMIVEDTTEDMVDVKISIMKSCPYTLQEKSLQEKKSLIAWWILWMHIMLLETFSLI